MKRIVVLYTRMAPYFWDCLRYLIQKHPQVTVDVVARLPSQEAPLQFDSEERLTLHRREDFSNAQLQQWVASQHPDLILVTGWTDKAYMEVTRLHRGPSVCMIDNPYRANLRQQLASLFSRFLPLRHFSHAWVTGCSQYELARRLGFGADRILTGMYCANEEDTEPIPKTANQPRTLLFAGRLLAWKGIEDLLEAFQQARSQANSPWNLKICGTGPLEDQVQKAASEHIHYLGFVTPANLKQIMRSADAFCMASWDEHWGVVVHEAALAGLPLISSSRVGANQSFVRHQYNGFVFEAGNRRDLANRLLELMNLDQTQLSDMSKNSRSLGLTHVREFWCANLLSLLD